MIQSGRRGFLPLLLALILLLLVGGVHFAGGAAPPAQAPAAEGAPAYGVAFINAAEDLADVQRFANAHATGATWDRWPIYWPNVETEAGVFEWRTVDAAASADIVNGFKVNAILLGTPWFYRTEGQRPPGTQQRPEGQVALFAPETAAPQGLYASVFSDGSDAPGPGKTINEANVWARFVYAVVQRYRPGGVLAQQSGWPAGAGITHWEMWNEPDLTMFWDGTLPEYARLLKVGYLAAKHADPQARVLFGGLANYARPDFYENVLSLYDSDPLAQGHYFHDILATHSYFHAWASWYHVWRARETMAARGMDKPVWLNESGVAAWDDYPGPVWDPQSGLRATMSEQADYTIQSALYATYAGADAIFHFQLYDGCGNQPFGTDFPPHNGELCDASGNLVFNPAYPCAGDAHGLFRNPTDAACFTQHPQPETARPQYAAYRILTTYFRDVEPLWRLRPGGSDPYNGPQEWIAFYRPETGERVLGLWARFYEAEKATVPALNEQALLVTPDGITQTVAAQNGNYVLNLPAATNQNGWDAELYPIGGRPYLLIESDKQRPTVVVEAPAHVWQGSVSVQWQGDDGLGGGMRDYSVSVAVDGGAATPWLSSVTEPGGVFPVEAGHSYTFAVTGRDRAGNVSSAATATVTALELEESLYLPVIRR